MATATRCAIVDDDMGNSLKWRASTARRYSAVSDTRQAFGHRPQALRLIGVPRSLGHLGQTQWAALLLVAGRAIVAAALGVGSRRREQRGQRTLRGRVIG